MKPNQYLGLALAGLFVLGAASPACATYTGDFAPPNWQLISPLADNPGAFAFTGGAGNDEVLRIVGSATPGPSDTIVALKAPYAAFPGFLSFTWTLANNGNNGAALAYYYIDGQPAQILGSGNASGLVSGISLPADTVIGFELFSPAGVVPGKSPAVLEVSNWEFSAIPEAGTWLTGTLVLGILACEVLRWKGCAPAARGQK